MSIFEFDDQQGVRTRGTLRAPGATPGDVLTVGTSRGTVTPSPGGGSQPGASVWHGPWTLNSLKWQTVDMTNDPPDAGTFKLSYGAQETAAIAWDATLAELVAALALLPSLAGKVTADETRDAGGVTGPFPGTPCGIILADSLAPYELLEVTTNALTASAAPVAPPHCYVTDCFHDLAAFTPAEGEIVEDIFVQRVTISGDAYYLLLQDLAGGDWAVPVDNTFDLTRGQDEFTNFSGNKTSGLGLLNLASLVQAQAGVGGEAILPTVCLNSVPLVWSISPTDVGQAQVIVNVWAKRTAAPVAP